jgi:hypothetical protein
MSSRWGNNEVRPRSETALRGATFARSHYRTVDSVVGGSSAGDLAAAWLGVPSRSSVSVQATSNVTACSDPLALRSPPITGWPARRGRRRSRRWTRSTIRHEDAQVAYDRHRARSGRQSSGQQRACRKLAYRPKQSYRLLPRCTQPQTSCTRQNPWSPGIFTLP